MAKGEETRQRIIARAAPVFNTRGYSGTSMSALTRATGLEKGGIYNHFPSKEALAMAAFDHATSLSGTRFQAAMARHELAVERLLALIDVFADYHTNPPLPGGCPIINTAVEADDTDPALRARAQEAMIGLQKLIGVNVKQGVTSGELRLDADPRTVASLLTALLEGAVILSRLLDDPSHLQRAAEHARAYIRSLQQKELA